MHRRTRLIIALVAVMLLVLPASIASAAPSAWKSVDITLQSEQQQPLLLVSGELPPETKLPADAELAVPAGTQISWVGEILGGDPANDPELQYTKTSADGMDVYRFTLKTARSAQVEGVPPNPTSFDGSNYATALKWTAWQAVPEVRISQRVPQASQIIRPAAGASLQPGDSGYNYYAKTVVAPKAGEVIDLSFAYSLPAAGSATAGGNGASGGDTLVIVTIVALFGFGVVLLFLKVNNKMAAKAALREPVASSAHEEAELDSEVPTRSDEGDIGIDPQAGPQKKLKPLVVASTVAAVLVLAFAMAGAKGTSASVVDGKISRDFGTTSPCQSASVPFVVSQGVDLTKQGPQILDGFEGMEGVGKVTIDLAQSKIDMEWCESSQTEDSMRQVLSSTGLVTLK